MLLHSFLVVSAIAGTVFAGGSSSPTPVAQVKIGHDKYNYLGLVGHADFPSDGRDQYGDTAGGWGSGIAADLSKWKKNKDGSYSGIIYGVPDRGWNTNGSVDYTARIHRFGVSFTPYYGSTPVPLSNDQWLWTYLDTLLLKDQNGVLTTGLDADYILPASNGLPALPAGQSQDGTLRLAMDCEGLIFNKDGTFFISDEYGPNVYKFSNDGTLTQVIIPPAALIPMRNGTVSYSSDNPPVFAPNQHPIPSNPKTGRQNNQGFEGLTIDLDSQKLYVLLQSAAIQDTGTPISSTRRNTRLLEWDLKHSKWTGEWVVQLPLYNDTTTKIAAQSELHFLDKNRFFVLARDSSHGFGYPASASLYRQIDIIDISKATNIIGSKYDNPSNPIAPNGTLVKDIKPAAYYPFLNFNDNSQLSKFGLINGGPVDGPGLLNEKWESIALLPTFRKENEFFLLSVNDNDFVTQNGFLNFGETTYKDASGLNYNTQALIFLVELPDR